MSAHAHHIRSRMKHFSFATGEGTDHHVVRSGLTWTRRDVRLPRKLLALGWESTVKHIPKKQNDNKKRIPITITLPPEQHAFIDECAKSRASASLDSLFEAAITVLQLHKETLRAYLVEQEVLGLARDEVIRNLECSIVYRPRRSPAPRGMGKRSDKPARMRSRAKETHEKHR